MEFQAPSFSVVFPFLLFLFIFVKVVRRAISALPKLPPGPPKLPVIGNLHQLGSSLPHHTLRDLARKHGPLMHLRLGQVSTIVVSSPEVAKEVFRTHDIIFAQRPQLLASKIMSYDYKDIGFAPFGNYWRQLRKICMMELLSPSRVQSFRSIREEETSNLVGSIRSNEWSPINLSEKIFSLTYGLTWRSAFGKMCKGHEVLLTILTELGKLPAGLSIADVYPSIGLLQHIGGMRSKLETMHQAADRVIQKIVNEHKTRRNTTISEHEAEDLVDVFLKLQDQGGHQSPLTDNSIKAILLDIFTAGIETSSTTIEWAMSEMLRNPRIMKEAQMEVRWVFRKKGTADETGLNQLIYLKAVIKETLRLHPSLPLLLPRESSETCDILGHQIPAKTRLIVNAWAIGRDPKHWPEAERFYPERFINSSVDYKGANFQFIPFGAGKRICPGISFALANIELPLAQLLYHFDWSLPDELRHQDLDMNEATGLTARRKHGLILIPKCFDHSLPLL